MFDIGWQELFVVAILAIIVIGPKDLPRTVRTVTQAIRKLRSMAGEFQSSLDEVAREAELDEIRREANKIANYDVTKEIRDELDPDGDIEAAANIDDTVRKTMTEAKDATVHATDSGADTAFAEDLPAPAENMTVAASPSGDDAAEKARA
ncbi:MAG: Sec-independent protein translocase protein TatB [Rhodospirillaceae bacterium]